MDFEKKYDIKDIKLINKRFIITDNNNRSICEEIFKSENYLKKEDKKILKKNKLAIQL